MYVQGAARGSAETAHRLTANFPVLHGWSVIDDNLCDMRSRCLHLPQRGNALSLG